MSFHSGSYVPTSKHKSIISQGQVNYQEVFYEKLIYRLCQLLQDTLIDRFQYDFNLGDMQMMKKVLKIHKSMIKLEQKQMKSVESSISTSIEELASIFGEYVKIHSEQDSSKNSDTTKNQNENNSPLEVKNINSGVNYSIQEYLNKRQVKEMPKYKLNNTNNNLHGEIIYEEDDAFENEERYDSEQKNKPRNARTQIQHHSTSGSLERVKQNDETGKDSRKSVNTEIMRSGYKVFDTFNNKIRKRANRNEKQFKLYNTQMMINNGQFESAKTQQRASNVDFYNPAAQTTDHSVERILTSPQIIHNEKISILTNNNSFNDSDLLNVTTSNIKNRNISPSLQNQKEPSFPQLSALPETSKSQSKDVPSYMEQRFQHRHSSQDVDRYVITNWSKEQQVMFTKAIQNEKSKMAKDKSGYNPLDSKRDLPEIYETEKHRLARSHILRSLRPPSDPKLDGGHYQSTTNVGILSNIQDKRTKSKAEHKPSSSMQMNINNNFNINNIFYTTQNRQERIDNKQGLRQSPFSKNNERK